MENRRIIIFVIVSAIIHFLVFKYTVFEKPEKPKEKLTYVDIIDKKPEVKPEKPAEKPNILSDRDMHLNKKTENLNEKPPVEEKKIIRPLIVQKEKPVIMDKKPEEKKLTEKKVLQEDNVKEKIVEPNKSNIEIIEEKQKSVEQNEPNILDNKTLAKNILNPSEIINDIANYSLGSSKEGEDTVNFNSMKFKYASYFYKFKKNLYNVWTYPSQSILKGEEGTVRIKFSILKDGTITNIQVVSSSGYPDLDKAAVNALNTMGKVPLSDSFSLKVLNVDGYFNYQLGFRGIY
ncbi:energy transducer TonB [Deferribacteraceae bacterium V6Fe1]|nr:energy transducer TonB [Deferribacteraceae bacterium V6Fe1]